jgi:hypothetical protein
MEIRMPELEGTPDAKQREQLLMEVGATELKKAVGMLEGKLKYPLSNQDRVDPAAKLTMIRYPFECMLDGTLPAKEEDLELLLAEAERMRAADDTGDTTEIVRLQKDISAFLEDLRKKNAEDKMMRQ